MADPNTLYSTVVQSSATIVAIVGAIVTADVVGLTARRAGLDDDIAKRERDLASERNQADQLRLEWLYAARIREITAWADCSISWRTARQRLLDTSGGDVAIDDISDASFARWWDELRTEIDAVDARLDEFGIDPDLGFEEWLRERGASFERESEWLAQRRYNQRRSAAREASEGTSSAPSPRPGAPAFDADKVAEIAAQDHRITQIQVELDQLKSQRQRIGAPPASLRWGLGVLGLIAIAGLGPSLWFMPQDVADYRDWHKGVVIAGFVLSLVIGFWYVAWLMRPTSPPRIGQH